MSNPRALNDIKFKKTDGGMGRAAGSDDVISGLIFAGMGAELVFGDAAGNVKGFVEAAVDAQGNPVSYVRRFTYPEELEDADIKFTPKPENATLTPVQIAKNVLHYHIAEFFRMNPEGVLYVMVKKGTAEVAVTTTNNSGVTTDGDITVLQTFAGGNIRQVGVFNPSLLDVAAVQKECTEEGTGLEAKHRPLSVVLTHCGRTSSESDGVTTLAPLELSALPDKISGGRCNVSVLIGSDFDADLVDALGNYAYYGCIGVCIGAISKASVHESIAWVGKFPLGLKAPAFFNGALVRNTSVSDLELLNGKHYIFAVIHAGDADNYFNDSHTLDVDSSDYAYIENVRTIDKACRGIRGKLLPWLNSPLRVDPSNGQLESGMVSFLETTAGEALEEMEKAGEISGYKVEIDPAQNVLATSALEIVIKKVPVGVMRKVTVKIGYTTSL